MPLGIVFYILARNMFSQVANSLKRKINKDIGLHNMFLYVFYSFRSELYLYGKKSFKNNSFKSRASIAQAFFLFVTDAYMITMINYNENLPICLF